MSFMRQCARLMLALFMGHHRFLTGLRQSLLLGRLDRVKLCPHCCALPAETLYTVKPVNQH